MPNPNTRMAPRRRPVRSALGAALAAGLLLGGARADTPAPLRVGLRFPPPSPGSTGERIYTAEGLEAALAERIAAGLGRPARFVRLAGDAAETALAAGAVDVVVTRRGLVAPKAAVVASGFTTGLTVAMRSDSPVKDWPALAGRTVCVVDGRTEARALIAEIGATAQAEAAPAKVLIALRTGRCDAALGDAALLEKLFAEPDWSRFSATLPPRAADEIVVVAGAQLAGSDAARLADLVATTDWDAAADRWSRLVALEVYLDQDAPDCH